MDIVQIAIPTVTQPSGLEQPSCGGKRDGKCQLCHQERFLIDGDIRYCDECFNQVQY